MIKKLILKVSQFETKTTKLCFWQWLDHREKIKKLGRELEAVNSGDFKEIYRIAKAQQELLTTKNGKNL